MSTQREFDVGGINDFPEAYVRGLEIDGERIAVVRLSERLYAFRDACSHWDVDIAEREIGADMRITCWFHDSVFRVDTGEVLVGPADEPLTLYAVRIEEKRVIVTVACSES